VATYSTGIEVSWDGAAFSEIQSLSWNAGGGGSKGRSSPWTDEVGSVSLQCLNAANVSTTCLGTTATLVITGGGCALTVPAIYESASVDAELNGVTKYSVTLKILDQ
jgi:hypothetical protein